MVVEKGCIFYSPRNGLKHGGECRSYNDGCECTMKRDHTMLLALPKKCPFIKDGEWVFQEAERQQSAAALAAT